MLKLKKPVITRKIDQIIDLITEFLIRIKNSDFRIHRTKVCLLVNTAQCYVLSTMFLVTLRRNKKDNNVKHKQSNHHHKQPKFYIINN